MGEVIVSDLSGRHIADARFIDHGEIKHTRVFVSEIVIGKHSYTSRVFIPDGQKASRMRYVMDLYNFYQQGFFVESC